MGGSWFTGAFGDPQRVSKEHLLERAKEAVQEQLGIAGQPLTAIVKVHKVRGGGSSAKYGGGARVRQRRAPSTLSCHILPRHGSDTE